MPNTGRKIYGRTVPLENLLGSGNEIIFFYPYFLARGTKQVKQLWNAQWISSKAWFPYDRPIAIAPQVSNNNQAIGRIIWKHFQDDHEGPG